MSLNDAKATYAGFAAITGGVDSGRSPMVLDPTQLAWAVNATSRGNHITCRPGLKKLTLDFKDETGATDTTVESRFQDGRFQGASSYIADNGAAYVMASISGRLFLTDLSNYSTQDLTAQIGDTNQSNLEQTWFVQAENYLIIQNNSDQPFIFNGSTLRRATPNAIGGSELPIGNVMEYNNGRLWVALTDGRSFVAGDLAYSDRSAEGGGRGAILNFTENIYLNGGGAFVLSANSGQIRAMRSIAVQDNSTGQGPLQVFTTRGVFSVNAPFDRAQWQNTQSPIQTVSLLAAGATAQNSTVLVNGDVWFRSGDGIRSFVIARRDHGTWVNTPVSREVDRALNYDTPQMLRFGSATLFDNRLLFTVGPELANDAGTVHGITHRGLAVIDFSPVSQMFSSPQPVWEGIWTGLKILQILPVDNGDVVRCLIYALNDDNEIEIWELTRDERFDSGDNRIEWNFETPAYPFEDGGWNKKQLAYGDMWLNRIAGTVDVTVLYRPDSDPLWQSWATAQICAKYQECEPEGCGGPAVYLDQYRTRVRLPRPTPASCSSIMDSPYNQGYRFAARVEVTGYCAIPQMRLVARNIPEQPEGSCPPSTCTLEGVESTCQVNDYSYTTED